MKYDPDRFHRIDALFDAALELAPDDRAAFLDGECAGDVALRTEVESLLDSVDTSESMIGEHVADFAAPLIAGMPSDVDDPALEPDTLLGPWRIVREVGRGGMGTVYLAERADDAFELQVAVKVVKRGMDSAEVLRRFREERRILASLDHPNVARLLDGGAASDGRPYLVMEYVEGEPIDRWCESRQLDVRQRVVLFRSVCEAVHEAHRRLVVHRDIKPTNVLITANGTPKLLDFGIAKLLDDDDASATVTTARLLTPAYAAPEQIAGDQITTATDVFSLGVLLHELLTGERPAAVKRHGPAPLIQDAVPPEAGTRTDAAPPQTHARRALPLSRDLEVIGARAMAADPARRYGSALQLAEDLDRWLSGRPVLARPDSIAYRTSRFVRRNRLAVSAAVIAIVMLLGFAVAMAAAQRRTADALARVQTERDTAEEVASLLEGLFSAGDPTATRQERLDTFRVAALLDRSTERVRDDLSDQPAVQARLLRALGDAYRGMGLYAAADPLLHDAVAVHRTLVDSLALANALNSVGLLELERGRSVDAEPWLAEAVSIQRSQPDADAAVLVRMLSNLAATRQNRNDIPGAIALYDEAEQLINSAAVPDTGQLALILNGRGQVAQRAGDFEGAAAVAERILAIDRARLGPEHPRVAVGLVNVAFMNQRLGDLEHADSLQSEAVEMMRRTLGDDHPMYFHALAALANVRAERGLPDEARPLFERAIEAIRRSSGPTPDLGIILSQYADLLSDQGELAEAETVVREAVSIEQNANGPDHPNVGILTTQLARVRCTGGDTDGATGLFDEALNILGRGLPPTHPRVIDARRSLGRCLGDAGRFADAEGVLIAAFESLGGSRTSVDLPRSARDVATSLADLYDAWDRPADAAVYRAMTAAPDSP
jgi:serine/threonine-protein kinase